MVPLNFWRRATHRGRSERGAELIEVALTLPLLLLVVLGIIEFGFLFQQYEVVTNAAREGARVRVLPSYGDSDAQNRALEYLTAGGLNSALAGTPTVTPLPSLANPQCYAVTVTYPHPVPYIGGIIQYFGGSFGTITLTAKSTMRNEKAGSASCS